AFVAVPAKVYGSAAFPLSATSKSSGPIVYTVTSGQATVSGNMLTVTGIGKVSLQATQAATTNYVAATATTSFSVTAQVPTITFPAIPDQTFGKGPVTVSSSSNSPAPITYALIYGQAAVGNFAAATTQISFNVDPGPVTLTFVAIPAKVYGTSAPFGISATSASSGIITYSVVSGPAAVSGHTVTLTGSGTVTLAANQAAAGNYVAGAATTSFTVR